MKFDFAWTLAGQPRGETPAPPPGKRTPVLPRPVPPRQAHLPHRTPPASRVWRTCPWPVRSTPRRPANTAQAPAVIPAAIAQGTPWKYTDWAALIARCVAACLRGRIGPPRPNRLGSACWGASEIGSDFSNGGLRPLPDWQGIRWASREFLLSSPRRAFRESVGVRGWKAGHAPFGLKATHFSGFVSRRAAPIRSRQ